MPSRPACVLGLAILAYSAGSAALGQDEAPRIPVRRVAVFLYRGVELLDFAGPAEVFASARGPRGRLFRVFAVAENREALMSQGFLTIAPARTLDEESDPDIVVIPGGSVPLTNARVREWLGRVAPKAEVVLSVCNGALLLARCGLLDGLEATTHRGSIEGLTLACPKTRVREDLRYVDNGRIVTAGGVSAGIDGALRVVDRLCGRKVAQETADYMEYRWRPDDVSSPVAPDPRPGHAVLRRMVGLLEDRGTAEAVAAWNELKATTPAAGLPDESRLNTVAYRLLDLRPDPAPVFKLFEFNAAVFPGSANVLDSLSEACERLGRFEEARSWAEKALAKLPTDTASGEDLKERIREHSSERIRRLTGVGPGTPVEWVCPPCSCDLHDRTWPAPGTCEACGMALVAQKARAAPAAAPEDPAVARRIEDLIAEAEAGTRTAAEMLADPGLVDLHGTARFRRLMKERAAARTLRMAPLGESGTPLEVAGRIVDSTGGPVAGALVYAFHTDASGRYNASEGMDEVHSRLFGYVRTDADGRFTLLTIRPGGYPEPIARSDGTRAGIPEHIHVQVGADGFRDRLFGINFEDDPRLDALARSQAAVNGDVIVTVRKGETGAQCCAFEMTLQRR